MHSKLAFTLIELLIVVAIIAILAAIAVPNFLEAQVRSKVSRSKSDQRSLATAIESYRVDFNRYPFYGTWTDSPPKVLKQLTTPVAYMSSIPHDTFKATNYQDWQDYYIYYNKRDDLYINSKTGGSSEFWDGNYGGTPAAAGYGKAKAGSQWGLYGLGPDLIFNWDAKMPRLTNICDSGHQAMEYDPTNGTVSGGDIHRWGP